MGKLNNKLTLKIFHVSTCGKMLINKTECFLMCLDSWNFLMCYLSHFSLFSMMKRQVSHFYRISENSFTFSLKRHTDIQLASILWIQYIAQHWSSLDFNCQPFFTKILKKCRLLTPSMLKLVYCLLYHFTLLKICDLVNFEAKWPKIRIL